MPHRYFDLPSRLHVYEFALDTRELCEEVYHRIGELHEEMKRMQDEIAAIRKERPSSPSPAEDSDPLPF